MVESGMGDMMGWSELRKHFGFGVLYMDQGHPRIRTADAQPN